MKTLQALLVALVRILERWEAAITKRTREKRQRERDQVEEDPAEWFGEHFGGGVQRPADDARDADKADANHRSD